MIPKFSLAQIMRRCCRLCTISVAKRELKESMLPPQGYDSVLRKRREDLIGSDDGITSLSSGFELDVIEIFLKDVESGKVDDGRTKEYLRFVWGHHY